MHAHVPVELLMLLGWSVMRACHERALDHDGGVFGDAFGHNDLTVGLCLGVVKRSVRLALTPVSIVGLGRGIFIIEYSISWCIIIALIFVCMAHVWRENRAFCVFWVITQDVTML